MGPLPIVAPGGGLCESMLRDLNLRAHAGRSGRTTPCCMVADTVLQPASLSGAFDEPLTTYNPGARIAFLTLYAHHINSYARVSEHNARSALLRQARVHLPRVKGRSGGNRGRAWPARGSAHGCALRQHLAQHDWIIWIDADTLFFNQTRRIETLLDGRDRAGRRQGRGGVVVQLGGDGFQEH